MSFLGEVEALSEVYTLSKTRDPKIGQLLGLCGEVELGAVVHLEVVETSLEKEFLGSKTSHVFDILKRNNLDRLVWLILFVLVSDQSPTMRVYDHKPLS